MWCNRLGRMVLEGALATAQPKATQTSALNQRNNVPGAVHPKHSKSGENLCCARKRMQDRTTPNLVAPATTMYPHKENVGHFKNAGSTI